MIETFTEWREKQKAPNDRLLWQPPLPDVKALEFLKGYLLGEDWNVTMPLSHNQANTELVHSILYKCSKKYRKEVQEKLNENHN